MSSILRTKPPKDRPLIRFSLMGFLLFVAGLSVLLAVINSIDGFSKVAIVVSVLIVVAHVTATTIGSALCANALRRRRWYEVQGIVDPDESAARVFKRPLDKIELPNGGPLGNKSTRLPWLPFIVLLSAMIGAAVGGIGLSATIGYRVSAAGIAVGMVSTGLMGAWLAFLVGGFVGISHHAWRKAVDQQKRDRRL